MLNQISLLKTLSYLFSIIPFIYLFGVAFNNSLSVIMALYGFYIFLYKENFSFFGNSFLKFYSIFIAILIITSIFSDNYINSLKTSLSYSLYFFYVISSVYIVSQFKKYNYINLEKSIYLSVIVIFLYFLFFEFFNNEGESYKEMLIWTEGVSSLFENKVLGIYLSKIFPVLLGLILYLNKQKLKLFHQIIFLLIIFLILLSQHRTSIVLTLLFLIISGIYFADFRKHLLRLFILILFIASSIFLFVPQFSDSLIEKTKNQIFKHSNLQFYPDHYVGHYKTSINIIKQNLIIGEGSDSFKFICDKKQYVYFYKTIENKNSNAYEIDGLKNLHSCSTHTHNYYLQIFSENGAFAFFLLIIFYFFVMKELITSFVKKNTLKDNYLYTACLISTFCNFFPFAPSTDFYHSYINTIIYLPIIFILYFKFEKLNYIKIKR